MGTLASDGVTVTVEIAFSTANPLTSSPTWTDVSSYVRSISTTRGSFQNGRTSDVGTATVRLDNSDRRFDPTNTAGAYYPNVVPMKQIRISAVYSSTTYRIWRGFIQEWPQTWSKGNAGTANGLGADSEVTVTALDIFSVVANAELPDRYAMEVLGDSPLAYWRCDDPANDLTDSGPNGINGAWYGNTEQAGALRPQHDGGRAMLGWWTPDPATLYSESTGSTGEQSLPFTTAHGSMECWFYAADRTTFGGVQHLDSGNGPSLIILRYPDVFGDSIVFSWQSEDAVSDEGFLYFPSAPGQTIHVAVTYNDTTDAAIIYVNGQDVSNSSGLGASFYPLSLLTTGLFVFNFLRDEDADVADGAFVVSDIAIYDRVLTSTEVAAHYLAGATAQRLERSGSRVTAILDYIGVPSGLQIIGDGNSWLDYGPTPGNALGYLQQINDTEQGRLYVSAVGEIVFRDRSDDMERSSSITSAATFGDSGSELRYSDLVLDGGHVDNIRNEITVNPQSGLARSFHSTSTTDLDLGADDRTLTKGFQFEINGRGTVRPIIVSSTVRDSSSITAYGRRAEVFGSLHANQGDARNLGLWRLDRRSDPQIVVKQMTIQPRRSPTTLFPQVLDREIGNRITIRRRPQNVGTLIEQERIVTGVAHEITVDNWTTTWALTEATPSYSAGTYWRVGDATYGKVGTAVLPY